jgi:hypothetical protein
MINPSLMVWLHLTVLYLLLQQNLSLIAGNQLDGVLAPNPKQRMTTGFQRIVLFTLTWALRING